MSELDVPVHEPFEDPILGRVAWDVQSREWQFEFTVTRPSAVKGSIVPSDWRLPLLDQGLGEIRECIRWVRENEPFIRQHVADAMFDGWLSGWYDEEIDTITTKEQFRETISLGGAHVLEDRSAMLIYNDGGLFGGHGIVLCVGSDGKFDMEPNIWG